MVGAAGSRTHPSENACSHLTHLPPRCCLLLPSLLPSQTTEGFAVYENLLVAITLTGEPLGYKGETFKVGVL